MEKEEAKQKYQDQVSSGNTAAMVSYDEEVADVLSINLGSIQPGQTIKVNVQISTILETISKNFFNLNFPIEFYPKQKIENF